MQFTVLVLFHTHCAWNICFAETGLCENIIWFIKQLDQSLSVKN